jgi:hypothetical protein
MNKLFPETPILFYPSLAQRLGAEQALLLAIYAQYGRYHGARDAQGRDQFVIRRQEWLSLASFWTEEQLAQLTSSLVDQGVLEVEFFANGSLRLMVFQSAPQEAAAEVDKRPAAAPIEPPPQPVAATSNPEREYPVAAPLPVYEPQQLPRTGSSLPRGPAPSFGGSTGWVKPKDDLQQLFEQQEQHNRQLKTIDMNWQPQPETFQMLAKQQVNEQFARGCIDQFIVYQMGQNKRKISWEQPFMRWVIREKASFDKQQQRQQDGAIQQGFSSERDQATSRQRKREQVTRSVMDINNTDW